MIQFAAWYALASAVLTLVLEIVQYLRPVPAALRITMNGSTMNPTEAADQTVTLSLAVTDKHGRPVAPPTVPAWTTDDTAGAVAVLTAAADGLSATLAGVAPGTVAITVTLGPLSTSLSVAVTAATPQVLTLTFGTPD